MTSIEINGDVSGEVVQKNSHHHHHTNSPHGGDQIGYPLSVVAANNNTNNKDNTSGTIAHGVDLAQQNHNKLPTLMTNHDCGSNQSGSDSGLGYTNSLSSENNSLLANSADEPDQRLVNSRVDDHSVVKLQERTSSIIVDEDEDDDDDDHQHVRHRENEPSLSSSLLCETRNKKIVLDNTADTHISAKSPLTPLPAGGGIPHASLAAAQVCYPNNKFEQDNNASIDSKSTNNNNTSTTNKSDRTGESRVGSSNTEKNSPPSSTSLPLSRVKDEQRESIESTSRTGLDNGPGKAAAAAATSSTPHHHRHHVAHKEDTASVAPPPPPPPTTTTAKIKHSSSTKHKAHETANCTLAPDVSTTTSRSPGKTGRGDAPTCDGYDESDKIRRDHERLRDEPGAERGSGAKCNLDLGEERGSLPSVNLKSCIKPSVAGSSRPTKSKRNVSFNQTVIVFCEEIDAFSSSSSPPLPPSDIFEPPLDYRDVSGRVRARDQQDGAMGGSTPQGVYATTDDLEIINKIVGEDASNLTDDQLIGLLESGSLLESFDLSSADKFTINRLNSGQSYLCHDAISDSDSESSSLAEENFGEHHQDTNVPRTQHGASFLPKAPQVLKQSPQVPALQLERSGNQGPLQKDKRPDSTKISDRNDVQSQEESQIENIPRAGHGQKSMPARVRVTTVDSGKPQVATVNNRRQAIGEVQAQQRNIDHHHHQPQPQPQQRVITTGQGDHTQSYQPVIRQTNAHSNRAFNQNQYQNQQNHTPEADNPSKILTGASSGVSWANRQAQNSAQQLNLSTAPIRTSPSSSDTHNNPACHVCRAIELSRQQANSAQGDRGTTSVTNQIAPSLHTSNRPQLAQPMQVAPNHLANHTTAIGSTNQNSTARQSQPVPACVSCREISMHHHQQQQQQQNHVHHQLQQQPQTQPPQIYGTQTMRLIPTSSLGQQQQPPYQHPNLAPQPPTRPIACQLVYVVDQHGNRIRALQVVRPKQANTVTSSGLQQQQQQQQLQQPQARQIGASNYRFPNPTSVSSAQQQQLIRATNAQVASCNVHMDRGQSRAGQSMVPTNAIASAVDPRSLNRPLPAVEQIAHQSLSENQLANHVARKNHTVYLVRQPLDLQDSREALSFSSTRTAPRSSFPDAHEVRRLDGIRALPAASSDQGAALHRTTMTDANRGQTSNFVIDDIDDPTFGFSRRPAVKVVATNTIQEPRLFIRAHPTPGSVDQRSQILAGSQTLDRRNVQRDHSLQRGGGAQENMPTTSSMSNINKTLSGYGPGAISDSGGQNVNSKDAAPRQVTTSSMSVHKTRVGGAANSNPLQLKQGTTTSKSKPEVAYVFNI